MSKRTKISKEADSKNIKPKECMETGCFSRSMYPTMWRLCAVY